MMFNNQNIQDNRLLPIMVPTETLQQSQKRLSLDRSLLKRCTPDRLGPFPRFYQNVIIHRPKAG